MTLIQDSYIKLMDSRYIQDDIHTFFCILRAIVTEKMTMDVVFNSWHFTEAAANLLTNAAIDPQAKIPELKAFAAQVFPAREHGLPDSDIVLERGRREDVTLYIDPQKFTHHFDGEHFAVAQVGCGARFRNRRPDRKSSIRQYTAIMNVVISMGETSCILCLFRKFTNTAVSFSGQVYKTCTSG